MDINCLVFNDFETLDIFGPVEVFGKVEECCLKYFSINGGTIKNADNVQIITEKINQIEKYDVLIVPGGKGTRILVDDIEFIEKLKIVAEKTLWCLTVCTGSALLAKAGLLDDCEATSNKMAFEWVKTNGKNVCIRGTIVGVSAFMCSIIQLKRGFTRPLIDILPQR
jgi:putative intracellular protease/amidase